MSYEGKMLEDLHMPFMQKVEQAILKYLFRHNNTIRAFSSGEDIVDEIANEFALNQEQRTAQSETIYKKENHLKKSSLWHRLLFRAADNLAKEELVCRPTKTIQLTNKTEWMLTESGYDEALQLLHIPKEKKGIQAPKEAGCGLILSISDTRQSPQSNESQASSERDCLKALNNRSIHFHFYLLTSDTLLEFQKENGLRRAQ